MVLCNLNVVLSTELGREGWPLKLDIIGRQAIRST